MSLAPASDEGVEAEENVSRLTSSVAVGDASELASQQPGQDNSSSAQSVNSYTAGTDTDPYTPGYSPNPFTANVSPNPFVGAQSGYTAGVSQGDPYTASQSNDPYTPVSSSSDDQDSSGALNASQSPIAIAGVATGSFEFPDSVADWLRSEGTDAALEDFSESVASGTYSPNALATMDRLTPDQAVELQEYYESNAQTYAQFVGEPGVQIPVEGSHVPSIGTDPIAADEASNVYLNDPVDHFGGDHVGNYGNDPGDYANPDWQNNAELDEQFGEGANLQYADEPTGNPIGENSQAGTDFLNEQGYAADGSELGADASELTEASELAPELIEGSELLEGGAVAVEAAEGFEAADLLILLIFL